MDFGGDFGLSPPPGPCAMGRTKHISHEDLSQAKTHRTPSEIQCIHPAQREPVAGHGVGVRLQARAARQNTEKAFELRSSHMPANGPRPRHPVL